MDERGLGLFDDLSVAPAQAPAIVRHIAALVTDRPFGGYGVILADYPWRFANYSAKGEAKNPNQHYDCIPTDELAAMPVAALAADDAVLFMWATSPMLPDGLRCLDAAGFRYVAAVPWVKRARRGPGWAFGPGYWFREASEILLFGTRGSPRRSRAPGTNSFRSLIEARVREHSRKPDDVYAIAEAWFPGVPKLELFGRQRRPGWTTFGNETGKFR